jgi:integrase
MKIIIMLKLENKFGVIKLMNTNSNLISQSGVSDLDDILIAFKVFAQKTIEEAIEEFLSLKNSEQTIRAYRRDISHFFERHKINRLGDMLHIPYHELVRYTLAYINSFKKAEKYQPDKILNAKTINRKAYALSSFYKFLINVYNYPKNPVANFTALKVQRRSTTVSLLRSEMFEVIDFLKKQKDNSKRDFRNYLIFLFLFLLALRRNEIVNLQWKDINMDTQSISVFQKGGTYKELPIPDNLLNLLLEFKSTYGKLSPYIFHPVVNNKTKDLLKPLCTDQIFKMVKEVVGKVLPGKKITPHSFRKTFIELALNNNQDFISILNATGHTSIEMIKYYDTRNTLQNNAINNLGGMFKT